MTTDFSSNPGFYFEPTEVVKQFSPGSFFGNRFQIEGLIANGSMSTVYRAKDLQTERMVAVKVLRSTVEPSLLERFQREAEILLSLPHSGIVGIEGFGTSDSGHLWIAMELLQGTTLRDFIKQRGKLTLLQTLDLVRSAAESLSAAHAAGVIHRDLKPDNLFVEKEELNRIKILDFGLSSIRGAKTVTARDAFIGTPRYMAPETISSAKNASVQSDVYALGLIAYESLAGSSPFQASDHGQLLGAVVRHKIVPLESLRPDLPKSVIRVIEQAMAAQPQRRFATTHAFAIALFESAGKKDTFQSDSKPSGWSVYSRKEWLGLFFSGAFLIVATAILMYAILH